MAVEEPDLIAGFFHIASIFRKEGRLMIGAKVLSGEKKFEFTSSDEQIGTGIHVVALHYRIN